jgi:uncharacterized protein YjiS (DUF1127 family)
MLHRKLAISPFNETVPITRQGSSQQGHTPMNAFINTSSARTAQGASARVNRISAPVARVGRWLRDMSRRNAVINELDRLSDRELADIGLNRSEIRSVFTMADRHAR